MHSDFTTDETQSLGLKHTYSLQSDPTAPLIFLVHGRAGNMKVMLTFRRAAPEGKVSFVAPEAPLSDSIGGFSWWDVHNGKTIPENAEPAAKILSEFIDAFIKSHNLKPRAIIGLGFSQGGGLLSLLAQNRPTLFTGIGLLASFVVQKPEPSGTRLATSVFIAHGTQDETVPLATISEGRAYLESLGAPTTMVVDEVGHKVGTSGMRALKEWLAQMTSN